MRISKVGLYSVIVGVIILLGMLYAVFLPQAGGNWGNATLALIAAGVVGGVVIVGLFLLLMGLLMLII